MEIIGIKSIMDSKIAPHMEMFENYLEKLHKYRSSGEGFDPVEIEKEKEELRQEELDSQFEKLYRKYPILKVMLEIEKEFGEFHIILDTNLNNDKDTMTSLLFKNDLFRIGNPRLNFYHKGSDQKLNDNWVYGANIIDLCNKYVNHCLNGSYHIRVTTKEGEGYATLKIRNIILNSKVFVGVQGNL